MYHVLASAKTQLSSLSSEIKVINRSILSKRAHSFTCCTEMPGVSRFSIGFFFFTMNMLGKLLDIWGGTELYPPLVPTSGYKS